MSNLIRTFEKEAAKFDKNLSFGTGNFNSSELKSINNYFDFLKRTVDRATNSAHNFVGNSKNVLRSRKVLDLVNERVNELMNFVEVVPNSSRDSAKSYEDSNLDDPEIEDGIQQLQAGGSIQSSSHRFDRSQGRCREHQEPSLLPL